MSEMFLPFKRYADFSGRSRRKEYWLFVLFLSGAALAIVIAMGIMLSAASSGGDLGSRGLGLGMPELMVLVFLVYALGVFIPHLAVTVRRFHDQDKSGWFVLLGLIPYVGGLVVMIMMMMEGTRGPNRFGPDPKQPDGMAPQAQAAAGA